jgi:hypothetical protein
MNYETTSPQLKFASTHEHTTPIMTSKVFDLFQYEKVLQHSTIGFLLLLPLANKRKKLFIYTQEGRMASSRRAHQVVIKGLPSVREEGATSPHPQQVSNKLKSEGEGATSKACGLPPQKGATSPRGAHLPRPTCSYLKRYSFNQISIKYILSPLTS